MGYELFMADAISWVSYLSPTSSQYMKIVIPIALFLVSFLGMFSNLLPQPGVVYAVPDLEDVKTELKYQGRIIYRLSLLSRKLTLFMNRIIVSRPYRWFYIFTKTSSDILKRIKGDKAKSSEIKITSPEPYQVDLAIFKNTKPDE